MPQRAKHFLAHHEIKTDKIQGTLTGARPEDLQQLSDSWKEDTVSAENNFTIRPFQFDSEDDQLWAYH